MRIRSVHEELEVKLESTTNLSKGAQGKGEWKVYSDGSRLCKVSISNLNLPDGSKLELVVEDRHIAHLEVHQGLVRFRRETEEGESVPRVEAKENLQVLFAGQAILEGRFYSE
jgi:hypothetical protein